MSEEDKNKKNNTEGKSEISKRIEKRLRMRRAKWEAKLARREDRRANTQARWTEKNFNFGRFLIGLFFVFLGVFLLAKSLHVLPPELSIDFIRFWPFLVIALGLSLLDTSDRFSFMIALIVFLAVLMMFTVIFWSSISPHGNDAGKKQTIPVKAARILDWHDAQMR